MLARGKAQAAAEKAELTAKNERAADGKSGSSAPPRWRPERSAWPLSRRWWEKAYVLALKKLCGLPKEQYAGAVAELLVQAAPEGRGEVIFAPAQRDGIGKAAVALANEKLGKGQLVLAEETRPIQGGFILKNGNVAGVERDL